MAKNNKNKANTLYKSSFSKLATPFIAIRRRLTRNRVIVIVIIIAAFAGWRFYSARKADQDVKTATIEKGTVKEELILSGEIMADKHAKLQFPTSGKMSWIGVSEGDWVKKGQLLASLDRTTLDAAYQQARSNLRKYEATVNRVHDDLKDKDDSETYTEIETRVTAEANKDYYWDALRTAEYNLKNANLIAPFEGLVSYVANPFSGLNVLLSETQIEMVDPSTIYFNVSADQSEVIDLTKNQKVKVILDPFPDKEFGGEIIYISYTPKTGEVGAVYKIKVIFSSNDPDTEKIKVGMTGDAFFTLSEEEGALYVPPQFVNSDKKGKYILLSKHNNKVYVEVGKEGEDRVEIKGDFKEGDTVYD